MGYIEGKYFYGDGEVINFDIEDNTITFSKNLPDDIYDDFMNTLNCDL